MDQKQIENAYSKLLRDDNFQKLELLSKSVNIFEILRLEHYEIRHSNFLAWLLNPKGNHGLGSDFLQRFLNDLAIDERSKELSIINIQGFNFNKTSVYREWNSIDILIVLNDLVIAIENKINHIETSGQLKRYIELIEKQFENKKAVFVYLNPDGNESTQNNQFINYSYETILQYLEQIVRLKESLSLRTRIYIEDYITNLKNNIMNNGEMNILAQQIYHQHKVLLDFIYEAKDTALSEYKARLLEKVSQAGWISTSPSKQFIRFTTPSLNEIIPNGVVKSWKNGELFLFEIYLYQAQNQIQAYCTIGPSEIEERTKLLDIMSSLKTSKIQPKSFAVYKHKTFDLNKLLKDYGPEGSENIVELIWEYVKKIVAEVEPLILNNYKRNKTT